jgi:hypothetical protein
MRWMGRSFRAPRRADVDQWTKVQILYAHGFRFASYRRRDCAPLPRSLQDVADFLVANPQHPLKTGPHDRALLPGAARARRRQVRA